LAAPLLIDWVACVGGYRSSGTDRSVFVPFGVRRRAVPEEEVSVRFALDSRSTTVVSGRRPAIASSVARLIGSLLRDVPPVRFEFWDGSAYGPPPDESVGRIVVRSPNALRRILWAPGELGLGRAYVAGDLDVEGDIVAMVEALRDVAPDHVRFSPAAMRDAVVAAHRVGALRRPLPPPPQEAKLSGWRHSLRRDARAISHHYDVGNDFYRVVLGPTMTYSCARFVAKDSTLDEAQAAKHDLVARKLGLHERHGMRLLDVGCGWGSMAIHAAARYGASVVGITISKEQAERARARVAEAGVSEQVEIRLQDYRELAGETFDAISSIGMAEHVGASRIDRYFECLRSALVPTGRLLNHAISSRGGSKLGRRSFIGRYVFPDGELMDVGDMVLAMERNGFEVRDVESLREHYARTLRAWVANLEASWDAAVAAADEAHARIWRLYMAGSAVGFIDGGVSIHQVLGVVPTAAGESAMPATRDDWA
jgi:cyclopropane-fatty-acyl-phospholipid synthase